MSKVYFLTTPAKLSNEVSAALRARYPADWNGNYITNNMTDLPQGLSNERTTRIRRLTPIETERLMSWPDNWTIGSDTQRYKQCGNGVVSNVVQAVIENMKGCLR